MKKTKTYSTRRDMRWKSGFWYTGLTRKLTDKEAEPLLEKGIIYEVTPKRFVILDGEEMSWGDYLKLIRKRSQNKTKNQ